MELGLHNQSAARPLYSLIGGPSENFRDELMPTQRYI